MIYGSESEFEIAHFHWGRGDVQGSTDSTWIYLIPQVDGGVRLLGYDLGPETLENHGEHDWGYWIDIGSDDLQACIAMLLSIVFEAPEYVPNFDELRSYLKEWEIDFTEGDGPFDESLKRKSVP